MEYFIAVMNYQYIFITYFLFTISADGTQMVVTWSTRNDTASIVQYGTEHLTMVAKGSSTKFVDGGPEKATQYIHRVTLSNLEPRKRYSKIYIQ